jgi:uncharacterized integral membrane protein
MRFLSWVLTLVLMLIALAFAAENSGSVTVSLWPLNAALTMPLPLLLFCFLFAGLLLGSFLTWLGSFRYLWQIRRLRHDLEALHKKMDTPPSVSPRRFCLPRMFRRKT